MASAADPSLPMKESPKWLEIPHELMVNIFQRLRTLELLNGAMKVCTSWWRICKDPAIWKVIDVDSWDVCHTNYDLEMLTKKAVDLSCGELTDLSIKGFGTDDLLDYMLIRSSKLNSLSLWCCFDITGSGLRRSVKRVPQLEKLHLTSISINIEDIKVIGRNCPQLKSFEMDMTITGSFIKYDDDALAIANNMPELRHLQVFGSKMTNYGFKAILNGCPHLESLDVRWCYKINLDMNLLKECMERIKDFKSSTQNYYDFDDTYSSGYSDEDDFSVSQDSDISEEVDY
ncbi:unnamed protein product [Lactuca saligna]|uniref:F-box domain-containing protein n=1 Tax=Lactuca saligna TaxID=75948 RepID=A0AA35UPN2_LACSI|nr:unnamed protein product [Lactuca saligna]